MHGATQNLSGAIGATGAAIAFVDAIRSGGKRDPVADVLSDLPPAGVRSPEDIHARQTETNASTLKALLLRNGRALVFAASKDANIFMPLGAKFKSAADAHERFTAVRNDQAARA